MYFIQIINRVNKINTINCSLFTKIDDLNNGEIYIDILIEIVKKLNPVNYKLLIKNLNSERLNLKNIWDYDKNLYNLEIFIKYLQIVFENNDYINKLKSKKLLIKDKSKNILLKFLISILNNEKKIFVKKDIERFCNKKIKYNIYLNKELNNFKFNEKEIVVIVDWLKMLGIIPKSIINFNYIYLNNKDGKIFFKLFNHLENNTVLNGYIDSKNKPNFNILINYKKIINFLNKLDRFNNQFKDIDYYRNMIENKHLFWYFLKEIKIFYTKSSIISKNLIFIDEEKFTTFNINKLNNKENKCTNELNKINAKLYEINSKKQVEFLNNNCYITKYKNKKCDNLLFFIKENKYVNYLYDDYKNMEVNILDKLEFEFIEFVKFLKLDNLLNNYNNENIFKNNCRNGFLLNNIINKIFNISIKNICKNPSSMDDVYLNHNKAFEIIREKSDFIYNKYRKEVEFIIKGNIHLLFLLIKDLMEFVNKFKKDKIKFKLRLDNKYFNNKFDKFFYTIKLYDKYNFDKFIYNIHYNGQTGLLFLDIIKNAFGYLLLGCHYKPVNKINYQYNINRVLDFFRNLRFFRSEFLWKNEEFIKGNHQTIMRFLSDIIDYFYLIYFRVYKENSIFKNTKFIKKIFKFVGFEFDIDQLNDDQISIKQEKIECSDPAKDKKTLENNKSNIPLNIIDVIDDNKPENNNFLKNLMTKLYENAINKKCISNKNMIKWFNITKDKEGNLSQNQIQQIQKKMKEYEDREEDEKNINDNTTQVDFSKYTKDIVTNIINIINKKIN